MRFSVLWKNRVLPRVASELLVMPHLAEFMTRYPQIKLELALDDGFADLVGDGFDAGIRLGESVAPGMAAVPIGGPIRIVVVGSPEYFERHARPVTPDDLAARSCRPSCVRSSISAREA
ncbi:LysR substrate-binding domain-containing protein [Paraburkholderia sp. CNPSo 3274]|uniref:LysR substrate-binding domain-containing protein n=1 Tax=Paraburkholderia sp. CNPSo 3274 TaxID=2940932 RepID=UPI0020B70B37|nr:LysR substrate-binding domain-containing protein [Paraburkholderia sp. CNPSo 3274]MCP3706462.1 LysR substrate-binding domain-containing protein [Paraburkholderia sp. CNPSo 3274]